MSNAARKYPLFVNEFFMKRVNLFMNILPEVGLYNGAIGTVVEIVYNNRPEGPNDKEHYHLADYVVVDFPNLKLPDGIPPWDKNHKTVSLTFSSLLSLTGIQLWAHICAHLNY